MKDNFKSVKFYEFCMSKDKEFLSERLCQVVKENIDLQNAIRWYLEMEDLSTFKRTLLRMYGADFEVGDE